MSKEFLDRVLKYAATKHSGQFRKNGIEPYIEHPIRVRNILEKYNCSTEQMCAGLLHDVVEDTGTSLEQLMHDLNNLAVDTDTEACVLHNTINYVDALTNEYTKEAYPKLNRQQRKKLELTRFKKLADVNIKVVKFADIIDNLSTLEQLEDLDFAELYLCEDFRIIRALKIDHQIYNEAVDVFISAAKKLL